MKKMNNHGFTLMETLVTLLIMVILAVGMDTGMKAAMRVYDESIFFSESASTASMLDIVFGDVLRYASSVKIPENGEVDGVAVDCTFTNADYAVRDAYLEFRDESPYVYLKSPRFTQPLLNTGAFPNGLKMVDVEWHYDETNGEFTVQYRLVSQDGKLSTQLHIHKYLVLDLQ